MKITKILAIVVLLAVGLFLAPGVEAATLRNRNTGPGSVNTATRSDVRTYGHAVLKSGGALNIDLGAANTGNNNADGNTVGPNEVTTGETTADVESNDIVNLSTLELNQSDAPDADLAENDTTGPGSVNTAVITRSRSASFAENSTGGVLNLSLFLLNSGGNSASGNTTGANSVDTGDANLAVSHTSDVNGSDVIIIQ